ncbi:hypothetical protein MKK63_01170 [Methylobacterium sp. J-088]|uniref:hypothetical protein n=1 Tax=Methylobacterium sp. J-088 TaxID=2836664 RepID=UPI001FBA63A5|nr:hypothetical protein [Methylobacterium sp. J-088]MCJ2061328.1 hypothetical protein [Methylobacterium sp. J-088]
MAHNPAALGAPARDNGGGRPAVFKPPRVPALLNTLLALLAVLVVMAAHAAYQLVSLPFRLLRGLFRHKARSAPLTAR